MIFAGEASGDYYGANLIRALQELTPDLEVFGWGSKHMQEAGCEVIFDPTQLSVVGITEALKHLIFFKKWLKRLKKIMIARVPSCVVLIDFPGFNMHVAKLAHSLNIPVVYFVPPSAWAWGRKRAFKIAKTVDRVACILPMELDVYQKAGAKIKNVGHPLLNDIPQEIDRKTAASNLGLDDKLPVLALLPGSRKQEIESLYRPMLESCIRLKEELPDLQVILGLSPAISRETIDEIGKEIGLTPIVYRNKTREVIAASTACLCAGGTVTLEAALLKRPMVVVYKLSKITFFLVKRLVIVNYYTLPNLILGKKVVSELIQDDCTVENMVLELRPLLQKPDPSESAKKSLSMVRTKLQGEGSEGAGSYKKTAELVLEVALNAGGHNN